MAIINKFQQSTWRHSWACTSIYAKRLRENENGFHIMFPKQCYSTCGSQTSSSGSIISEIMRNIPWAPSQTY